MMINRKNFKFGLNFPIQMFLTIVRYTCKQYESLGSLPVKLLMLITIPVLIKFKNIQLDSMLSPRACLQRYTVDSFGTVRDKFNFPRIELSKNTHK
jgi:hypothetical protein